MVWSQVIRASVIVVLSIGVVAPARAWAQAGPSSAEDVGQAQAEVDRLRQELAALRAQYDARLAALEERLKVIGGGVPVPTAVPEAEPAPQAPLPPQQQPGAGASKVFNPDIAVIGNFLGVAGKNKNSTQPALGLNEVETSLQAIVDPYARADFFLAAGPEGLEIEEGYVTFSSLPAGLLLKVGKMRAQFGKVNTLHAHTLPWTDRPLVTQNLVGGEEGISLSGVSLSRLITNSALFLEATGEAFYGDSEVFASPRRSKLTYVGRIRAYRDITEGSNLDVGGSVAFGPTAGSPELPSLAEDSSTTLFGFDATFRYRPLRRAIYRRFLARTELIWSRPRLLGQSAPTAFGFYGSGEYQFARRWFAGARYDRSAHALDASLVDTGGSATLTFWPSEFNQVRGQYRRINYGDGVKANEFLFQILFSIGAHGAHVF